MLVVVLSLVAISPIAQSAMHLWGEWRPTGDTAVIALRARDVGTAHTPLLGMPTTLSATIGKQAHHLGPMEFFLLAPAARLGGDNRLWPTVAITALNIAAAVGLIATARSLGGSGAAALAAGGTMLLLGTLKGEAVVDPWNPYAALLPLAVTPVLLAADLHGRRWALPLAAATATFVAQAHVALVSVVVGMGLVWVGIRARRLLAGVRRERALSDRWRARRWSLVSAAAVTAVLWLPVAIEQVVHWPGNIWLVVGGAQASGPSLGLSRAGYVAANALAGPPPWWWWGRDVDELINRSGVGLFVRLALVLLLAAAIATATRRRAPAVGQLVAMAGGGLVLGVLAVSRVPEQSALSLHNYLWSWPLAITVWCAAVAGAGRLLAGRVPRSVPLLRVGSVVVLLGLLTAVGTWPPRVVVGRRAMSAIGPLSDDLRTTLEPGAYRLEWDDSLGYDGWTLSTGLLFAHEDAEATLLTGPDRSASVGPHRVADEGPIRGVLSVVIGRRPPEAPRPGGRTVASYTPDPGAIARVEAAERIALDRARRTEVTLVDGTTVHPDDLPGVIESGQYGTWADLGFLSPAPPPQVIQRLQEAQGDAVNHVKVFVYPPEAVAGG